MAQSLPYVRQDCDRVNFRAGGGGCAAAAATIAAAVIASSRRLMLAMGLLASWLGTLWWNQASRLLPTTLSGQLIVFETLAALSYAFWLRGQWPEPLTLAGIVLLVAGVIGGVRVKAETP